VRVLTILLLTFTACHAQSDQNQVEAVLKKMERAEQTGDFNTLVGLFTREKAAEFEKMRPYVKARPAAQYRATAAFARGDQGVILAEGAANSFVTLMLRRESGEWKIQDLVMRDTAANPDSVYALIPPDPGAFTRAGSHWEQVPPAMGPSEAARQGWQMKAVFDDSYLYIRFESSTDLPAPGSTIEKPPGGWPVLKINVPGAGEFVLYDAVNVGDQATFDEHGKANSHRAFAAYMIRMERNHHEIFSATAGLDPSPLLEVSGRNYDIRIPLLTMGIKDSRAVSMTIGDAQWPKSAVLSFTAQRYPR
jgi:hypothetical protein